MWGKKKVCAGKNWLQHLIPILLVKDCFFLTVSPLKKSQNSCGSLKFHHIHTQRRDKKEKKLACSDFHLSIPSVSQTARYFTANAFFYLLLVASFVHIKWRSLSPLNQNIKEEKKSQISKFKIIERHNLINSRRSLPNIGQNLDSKSCWKWQDLFTSYLLQSRKDASGIQMDEQTQTIFPNWK